jgi:hypothetical protein
MIVHVGDYIQNKLNGLIHEVVDLDPPLPYTHRTIIIEQVTHPSSGHHHLGIPADSLDEYWEMAKLADVAKLMLWFIS